jgi:hypothetical protein
LPKRHIERKWGRVEIIVKSNLKWVLVNCQR